MSLAAGSKFGPYEIAAAIGRGGMGEVFRARDTKLQRDVALKLLPPDFASDSDRLARFQREAQVLASLNHPNIAQIYGFEDSPSARCIVMEFVDGETLEERLQSGPIPFDETLKIAREIAAALEAAHERGIVHRDLKPANIKVTPDGKVKVLDFGLAKALAETRDSSLSNSPTLTMAATQQGIILGTAAYMSPEQARGKRVDRRTDVWAFGCVVYEMLTGKRAFDGSDVSELLASVIKSEPLWERMPAQVPPLARVFLRRCLEKDPEQRVHDIADVRLALDGAFDVPVANISNPPSGKNRTFVIAALCGLLAISLAVFSFWFLRRTSPPAVSRLIAGSTFAFPPGNPDPDVSISSDGRRIVYAAGDTFETRQLFVRSMDELEARPLRGLTRPRSPFMSPDGNWVGFFEGSILKKIAINGGPALPITTISGDPRGVSWGEDDFIVFAGGGGAGLLRVPAGGGEAEVLTKPAPEQLHFLPEILPGGRAVLFTIAPAGNPQHENDQIAVLELQSRRQKVLISGGSHARYSASGHIVYAVSGTLRAVPFDLDNLEVTGDPVPVVEGVMTKGSGAANFSIARDGTLTYVKGDSATAGERILVWVDRQGREEPLPVPQRAYAYPRISPDGTRVALDIRDQENDVWIWEFSRRTLTRLTFDRGLNRGIAWTPDSKRIAFSAQRDATENIYWQAADGTGSAERLTQGNEQQFPTAFTTDGSKLIFLQGTMPYDLAVVDLKGDRQTELLMKTSHNENNGAISPDGRWLAYDSNESGQGPEIYVRPFPNVNGGRWQISVGGGTRPVWARNGRELFYYSAPRMMAVTVESGASFAASSPKIVFEGRYVAAFTGPTYDVSPDGRRFLMIKEARTPDKAAAPPQLVVVLNWHEELKRLVVPK